MDPCIPRFLRIVEFGTAALSYAVNGALLFLILCRTPEKLKGYSHVLLCNLVVDVTYTTIAAIVQPYLAVHDGVAYMMLESPLVENQSLANKFAACWVYVFVEYMTISTITLPFIYRYLTVCRNAKMSLLGFAALTTLSIVLGLCAGVTGYIMYMPSVMSLPENLVGSERECNAPGSVAYFRTDQINFTTLLPCLVCLSIMWLNYVAIIWCSFRVRRTLKRRMSLSLESRQRTTNSVNRQISIVMLFQAGTPLFLAAIPMGGSVLLIALGQSVNPMMSLATRLLAFIPVLNPLYAICFVKSYRDFFVRGSSRVSHATATTASMVSSA